VAEISQNNPYCQEKFLADGFLGMDDSLTENLPLSPFYLFSVPNDKCLTDGFLGMKIPSL
jgi:hypothetical protein